MELKNKIINSFLMLLVLISGSTLSVYAQSGLQMSVSGQVREFNSNEPLAGINIELSRLENEKITDIQSSKSNQNGYFKIRFLKTGHYKFSIDIPEIGLLYIDFVPSRKNYYQVEIEDGKNIELNVFLGEYLFPYISRKDSLDSSKIDFVMFFTKEMVQGEHSYANEKINEAKEGGTVKKLEAPLNLSSPCDLLHFNYWCPIFTVPENFPLDFEDGARGVTLIYKYYKGIDYDCEDDRCKYDFRIEAGACIAIKSPQWHAANMCDSQSTECGECYYECTRKHELVHWEDFKKCFVPIACKYIEQLKIIPVDCECREDWVDKCRKKYYELIENLKAEYRECYEPTEDNAYGVSDPCDDICDSIYSGSN